MTEADSQSPRTLESLPDELLLQIISFLKPKDLIPLHKTSARLRSLTREDPHLWRYATIESHNEKTANSRERAPALVNLIGQLPTPHAQDPSAQVTSAATEDENYSRYLPPDIIASGGKKIDWYEEWKWRFGPLRIDWLDHHYPRGTSTWGASSGSDSTDEEDDTPGLSNSFPSTCSSSVTSLTSLYGKCNLKGGDPDVEVRGITGFSSTPSSFEKDMFLSPLSDGSVVIFDLRRFGRRRLGEGWDGEDPDGGDWGRILGRSNPRLVSVETSTGRGSYLVGGNGGRGSSGFKTTTAPNGVVECVSVDSWSGKGYVAVEGRLIEIDLQTLRKTAIHPFAFSITALSQTSYPFPLTVCTSHTIHLHDPRISSSTTSAAPQMAPLHQTGALSVLHSNHGKTTSGEESIYVAGRFKVILVYERRMFPKLNLPLHTGARLCTLSSFPSQPIIPSGFSLLDEQCEEVTRQPIRGETLVAGGEYNGRGSLEIYPSSVLQRTSNRTMPESNGSLPTMTRSHPYLKRYNHGVVNPDVHHLQHDIQQSILTSSLTTMPQSPSGVIYNRQSASRSKILAVDASQGTRLITGDADGILRWVERDGRAEIRRFDIFEEGNKEERNYEPVGEGEDRTGSQYQRTQHRTGRTGGGSRWGDGNAGYTNSHLRSEVVRKVIAFGDGESSGGRAITGGGVVVWTGERVGVVSVGHRRPPQRAVNGRIERKGDIGVVDGGEISPLEEEAERYEMEIRTALERQSDELRILKGLNIIDEKLRSEISEELGIAYLTKASEADAQEVAHGHIYAEKFRAIFPLVVAHGDKAHWVTYLSSQASKLVGVRKGQPTTVKIGGSYHPVHMSPESSHFSDVNLLGVDFLNACDVFPWYDYENDKVRLYFGKEWVVVKKSKL
ncbi:hypothetical protein BDZ91DRAFT_801666 [Kalaharituber pfeilii]|nr:hypothetical protein BDZ91DRAFT_801666 [Kalaharituber pfeilii]